MSLKLKTDDLDYALIETLAAELHDQSNVSDIPKTMEFGQRLLAGENYKSCVDALHETSVLFIATLGPHAALPSISAAFRLGLMLGLRYHEEKERRMMEELCGKVKP